MNDPPNPKKPSAINNSNPSLDGLESVAGTPSEGDWGAHSACAEAQNKNISINTISTTPNNPKENISLRFSTPEAGRYLKGAVLGMGGMGRVWSAQDQRLQRVIALKELSPAIAGYGEMRGRLAREAWITAQLEHPGIVPVYDAGQGPDGTLYYAMRLVRGRSLDVVIEATPLLADRLLLLRHFRDVCEAIAYAHSMGIVHRDLKPQNIMIGEFGETQVVDWGLARSIREGKSGGEDEGERGLMLEHASMTHAGEVVGTPHFMSPEQAKGLLATEHSDIWSLGAVLYVLLTRTTPMQGDSQALLAVLRGRPEIASVLFYESAIPPELAKIAERALQVSPADRYPSVRALVEDVTAWLEGGRVGVYDYSRWELLWRFVQAWKGPLVIGLIALVLLGMTGAFSYRRVVDEQMRTANAEQKTRESLALADQNLANALIEQALTIAPLGAHAEAETLAAHALMLQESPEARGIIAQFSIHDRFQFMDHIAPPSCITQKLSSQGEALICIEDGALSVWDLQPFLMRWRRPLDVLHVSMLDESGRIFVQLSPLVDAMLDASNGDILKEYTRIDGMPKGFALFSKYVSVLGQADRILIYDALTGEKFERVICSSSLFEPAVAIDPSKDMFAVFCNDLQTLNIGPIRGHSITAVDLPIDGGLSILQFSSDGALLVGGNTRGEVVLIDAVSKTVVRRIHAGVGVISRLLFLNDDNWVLIAGEKGGAMLWDIRSGVQIGRLPWRAGRDFSVSSDGQSLITLGKWIQRWAFPKNTAPHVFKSDENPPVGFASACLSPDEQVVVGNRGDGKLLIFSVKDGAHINIQTDSNSPIKSGAFSLDGAQYYPISGNHNLPAMDTKTWHSVLFTVPTAGRLIDILDGHWLVRLAYNDISSYIEQIKSNQHAEASPKQHEKITLTTSFIDIGANQKKTFAALLEEHAPQRVLRFATKQPPSLSPCLR